MNELLTEPNIYFIGKQVLIESEFQRFLKDEKAEGFLISGNSAAENLVEITGRIDYSSYQKPRPGGNSTYLQNIKEKAHGSVTEIACWTFILTGVSRSLTHELIRHRVGISPSQRSQRYVNEQDANSIVPDLIAEDSEMMFVFEDAVNYTKQAYKKLVSRLENKLKSQIPDKTALKKACCEAARSVLVNATETKICITANCRALRNFMELRGSKFADKEMRKLAIKLWKILVEDSPNLFNDYILEEFTEGEFQLVTPYRKI